jgi:hypothetical protein
MELINECRIMFGVKLPSESIAQRTKKFICKLLASETHLPNCLQTQIDYFVHMYVYERVPTHAFLCLTFYSYFFKNSYHEVVNKVSYISPLRRPIRSKSLTALRHRRHSPVQAVAGV